uniref:sphingolipid 4-desaturase n=1 Tax=Romanomermis culicivorax TaxID=13658 RepID=A0A915K1D0_ROMCU
MGAKVSRTDYEWSYSEEPHASRRRLILEKHPEIKQLFGVDRSFKYVTIALVLTQAAMCYFLKNSDWLLILLQAYFVGGTINHALTLAVHEISHNIAFGSNQPAKNRFLGMIANLPIGLPMSISFKKYHIEHHRYMGEEVLDTDIPTRLEAKLFRNTFTKFVWLTFQPIFYCFRPMIIYKKSLSDLEVVNAVIQLIFDYFVVKFFGARALFYLLFGSFIALGLHPTAGHFIAEHYIFQSGQETYSYTGILNLVTFNVGYHVEHHDFPFIPGNRLPLVSKMAPEFYRDLYTHSSWVWVLWQFVTNPAIGPYARIRRAARLPPDPSSGQSLFSEYVEAAIGFLGFYDLKNFILKNIVKRKALNS